MKLDTVLAKRENKVVYKDGALAAKVFDECYPKSDILNEALNQARVEETGLNIPKIEEVTKIDGKWAIISTFIEGKTLAELIPKKRTNTSISLLTFRLKSSAKKHRCLTNSRIR